MKDSINLNLYKIMPLNDLLVEDVFYLEKKIFGSANIDKISSTIISNNLHYFVLLYNKRVIGFFECLVMPPEAELYDIAIDEEFRNNGFGFRLLSEFESFAKNNDCNTLLLEVNKINKPAILLYKKFGFEDYGVRKNYYGDNDAILMKKLI